MEITKLNEQIISKLVLEGDLSKMSPIEKTQYYNIFCEKLGLNPLTQPFQIIKFQGKETLYAKKDCTEQLRKIYGVSITDISTSSINGVFIVTAKAIDKDGKIDVATGAVTIDNLKGDNLANALMKAETKAKRRVTLSICGLGILDESEIETIPNATIIELKEDIKRIEEGDLIEDLHIEYMEHYAAFCDLVGSDYVDKKYLPDNWKSKTEKAYTHALSELIKAYKTAEETLKESV